MRKLVFLGTLLIALAIASGASAQVRDPFDPLIVPGGTGGAVTAPEDEAAQPPAPAPDVSTDRLGDTGFDPAPYLVVAYGLLALGGAALFLSRNSLLPSR
ncbi:MAG: hypothetical protein ABR505_01360 [Actinomycetota bacterium]